MASAIWGDDGRRWTGIHAFSVYGLVKPKSGVNMDEMEWAMLVENFPKVKEVLKGKSVDLSACMRSADYEEYIKMYAALWFVDDKPLNNTTPILFYSEEEAKSAAYNKPVRGVDYPENGPEPQLRIETLSKPPPDSTFLMNLIMVHMVNRNILYLSKKNCEACQIGSDSQFDHCHTGNCLDEVMNHVDVYYKQAREMIQMNDLMNVFDEVHRMIGARKVFCKHIAKCAVIWISDDNVIDQIATTAADNFLAPLMDVIKKAEENKASL